MMALFIVFLHSLECQKCQKEVAVGAALVRTGKEGMEAFVEQGS